jgi:lipopolysaccharide export system protein LptA
MSASHNKRQSTVSARWRHAVVACCVMVLMMSPVVWAQPQSGRGVKQRTTVKTGNSTAPTNPQKPQAARKGAKGPTVKRITPQIPKANRNQTNRVFLENADILKADTAISHDYQILKGNVRFRRGDMYMFCDSAYFYPETSSLDAFGHVRMTQGDTLWVYSDVLHYYGDQGVAELRHNVRLENRSTTLLTDKLDYEINSNVGYYFDGGTIVDNRNNTELSSRDGSYELDTKQAEFANDVHLVNDRYEMFTELLEYNTQSHIARIKSQTLIVSDSNTINTTNGWYNTGADDATLYERSLLTAKDGKTLQGDTVYYNRKRNYGEARGDVLITDPSNKVILDGDYGYHDDNVHYSYVTGRARAREFSQKDTIYLHADTLCTLINAIDNDSVIDSVRVLRAFNQVRFYRSDVQGICDSLQLSEADTIINMYNHAVVWNLERQIFGDEINVHLNDSAADWATLPTGGFMAEHLGEIYYDQLSGKKMKAWFEDKELRQLDVDGNVQVIMFPQEKDSTYNKMVNAESSYMRLNLKSKQEVDRITMWPEVTGKVTPLYLARKTDMYLPQFQWYDALRPKSPDDIYDVSDELKKLTQSIQGGTRRRSGSNANAAAEVPSAPDAPSAPEASSSSTLQTPDSHE